MAKAVRSAPPRARLGGAGGTRPPLAPPRTDRAGLVAYFQGVWEELRKVVWPARDELLRMTGIVIATVILFGILIGGADYLLSLGVRQLYTGSGTTTAAPSAAPSSAGQSSAAQPTPAHATPLPNQ